MKKVNLFLIGLVTLVTLNIGFSSCSKDDDEEGNSSGGETLNVNGSGRLVTDGMYYLHNNNLLFSVINYTEDDNDKMVSVRCEDWNWDNITIGTDLISLYRKENPFNNGRDYYYPDCNVSYTGPENYSYLGDHSEIKEGQIILKSKDLSQKQFKIQFKDLILGYSDPISGGGGNYDGFVMPADVTISGEFLFTYEEIK